MSKTKPLDDKPITLEEPKAEEPRSRKGGGSQDLGKVQLISPKGGGVQTPMISFKGDAPDQGRRVKFTLKNGVVYSGLVADVVDVDGETVVSFRDGISPDPSK